MNKAKSAVLKSVLFSLSLFSLNLSAQTLYFCKGYSEAGEPKSVSQTWNFDGKETQVVFLYNNGKTTFDFASLFFTIENKTLGTADKTELKVAQNRNWDVLKYTFRQEGDYTVSVFGNDNKLLAKGDVKIGEPQSVKPEKVEVKKESIIEEIKQPEIKEPEKTTNIVIPEPHPQTKEVLYYDDLKVIFCEGVKEGKPVNEKTIFKMGEAGVYVEIVLQSSKPLNTNSVTVDVWQKEGEGNSFSRYIDDYEVKFNGKNKQVNFHRSFFKPGEYKLSFFNENNIWMTTGYVTVVQ